MSTIGHNGPPDAFGGWVKVYRDIREHPIVGHCNPVKPKDPRRGSASRGEAWQDLIMEASYKPMRRRNKGQDIWLDAGDLMAAHSFLATRWNWTVKQVRRFLDVLEENNMIARKAPKRASEGQAKGKQAVNQPGMQKGKQVDGMPAAPKTNMMQVISICSYNDFQSYDLFMTEAMSPLADVSFDEKGQPNGQPRGQPTVPTVSENGQQSKNLRTKYKKDDARARSRNEVSEAQAEMQDALSTAPPPDVERDPSGELKLLNGIKAYWLEKFGDELGLELALKQAAGYVQPNSYKPLQAQVESQLSQILQKKLDQDRRYAKAAARSPGRNIKSARSLDDALAESRAAKAAGGFGS